MNENDLTEQIKFNSLRNGLKNFKECHVVFTPAHVIILSFYKKY